MTSHTSVYKPRPKGRALVKRLALQACQEADASVQEGCRGIAQAGISTAPLAPSSAQTTLVPCCLSLGDNSDVPGRQRRALSSLKLTESRGLWWSDIESRFLDLQLRELSLERVQNISKVIPLKITELELKLKVLVTQSCLTLCDPMDCSPPALLSMELSRQEYWSGLPFHSPVGLKLGYI